MRLFLWIAAVLLVAAVAVMVFFASRGGAAGGFFDVRFSSSATGTKVRVEPAARARLVETISAPGIVEPRTKVDISAEVSARIIDLPYREGDEVKSGEVVVRLDDRDLRAALDSARARREAERYRLQSEQAGLSGPRANLEFARRQLERQKQLLETGDISRETFEAAQQRVDELDASIRAMEMTISVLESSLAAADADIARAEEALARTVIRAPIDGLVTRLNAEVGELVVVGTMNNPGTVILTIADLSRMLLKAEVAESDVARVREGQRAHVYINAYPDVVFDGAVERVDLQRTDKAGQAGYFETEVRIDLDGRRILSGLAANVDIEVTEHDGVVVPSQAILQRVLDDLPDHIRDNPIVDTAKKVIPVVYRMVDGKARCTPVRVGPSDLTRTLVLQGVSEGDVVVTGPYRALEKLADDAAITPDGPAPPSAPGPTPPAGVAHSEASARDRAPGTRDDQSGRLARAEQGAARE